MAFLLALQMSDSKTCQVIHDPKVGCACECEQECEWVMRKRCFLCEELACVAHEYNPQKYDKNKNENTDPICWSCRNAIVMAKRLNLFFYAGMGLRGCTWDKFVEMMRKP